ncbi:hypothetical protein [Catenulispora rubra]|uniref:hypothetical protein n=1 Tax=Catenulispora rubra TaxID=280293 RepID=UPI0018924246|nr:hypothetical protein [Catenulispora rubra]
MAGIAAVLVPILITVTGQSLGHLASFALFAAACVPWVALAVWPHWPHHRWLFATMASLAFVGGGLAALAWQDRPRTSASRLGGPGNAVTSGAQNQPDLYVAAKQLRFREMTQLLPFCANFSGTGTIPAEDVLILFDRPADVDGNPAANSGYSYDGRAKASGDGWSADRREIGTPTAGAVNAHALITALLVPRGVADFLDAQPNTDTNTLPVSVMNLGAVADQITITRSADNTRCSY